ncbi:monovalent cation/H+ antiporter complex subunit F [Polymorphobacter sp.]|uniref:monovalent cation/H+ antiporter complex subunit F n=1 Tax=Polymorphobacter sp. TaxID=1909290 RepID=UPI003F71B014
MIDMSLLADILSVILCIALACAGWRLVRGPSLADRFIAFDMLTALGIAFSGLTAVATARGVFLDIALALALLNFAATAAFALFLEHKARGQ